MSEEDIALTAWILERGAKIDIHAEGLGTPLEQAAHHVLSEFVQHFLEHGADPKVTTAGGTVWHFGVQANFSSEFKNFLLAREPDDVAAEDKFGQTALMLAVRSNRPTGVRELAALGASIATPGGHESSLAHYALSKTLQDSERRLNTMELLIFLHDKGVQFDVADEHGATPLTIATLRHDGLVVHCLLRLGVDVRAMDREGRTALNYIIDADMLKKHVWIGASFVCRMLTNAGLSVRTTDPPDV